MNLLRLLAPVAAAMLLSAPLLAQRFEGDVRVNDDAPGAQQSAPQIQVAPDGTIHAMWIDFRSGKGEIAMARSSDRGATFSPTRIVLPGRHALAGMQRGAQFVIDRQGGVHVVYQERTPLGKVSAMYSRSTDAGASFSTPIYAGADSGRYNQDFPSIAIDSSDNIYLAWVDDRDHELGTTEYTQLYFTRSTDRGASFSAPVVASRMPGGVGGSCECCNTAIATTADGVVFIAFRGNIANVRDVNVARTADGGATFDVFPAASSSWTLAACPMTGSSIAIDRNDRAHVVWRDSRQSASSREIVYHASLGRADSSCTLDKAISDSPKRTNFPSIGITREGAVVVAWQDTRTDANDIRYSISVDGGNTFAPSAKLSNESAAGRQELVALAIGPDGTRYAAWQDLRGDAGDIYFNSDRTPLSLTAPAQVTALYPIDGATVATVPSLAWSAPANLGDALQTWYSVEVEREGGAAIVLEGVRGRSTPVSLAPGRYTWRVTASTLAGSTLSGPFSFTLEASAAVDAEAPVSLLTIRPTPTQRGEGATVTLTLRAPGAVSVAVVDMSGRIVERALDEELTAGAHVVDLAKDLPAGHYRCRIIAGGTARTIPLIVR
jgi:hypothetical protein